MFTYKVHWETQIGAGATFYSGVVEQDAVDEEEASSLVRFRVWQKGFKDFSQSHIQIVKVQSA